MADSPLISGDANAVSELNNTVGSHNSTHNEMHQVNNSVDSHSENVSMDNHSVTNSVDNHATHNSFDSHTENFSTDNHSEFHNTDSHDTVSNHVTYVLNGQAAAEMTAKDKKAAYKKLCLEIITSGIISTAGRRRLDEAAEDLGLSDKDKAEVEASVKNRVTSALSPIDRANLEMIERKVRNNDPKVFSMISKLEAIEDADDEGVQFYLNLLRASTDISSLITHYESRRTDSYWQAFWAYFAYMKNGVQLTAEKTLRHLSQFTSHPMDNLMLLQALGCLVSRDTDGADHYLGQYHQGSDLLDDLAEGLMAITGSNGWYCTGYDWIDFYLSNLLGARPRPVRKPAPAPRPEETEVPAQVQAPAVRKFPVIPVVAAAVVAIAVAAVLLIPRKPDTEVAESPVPTEQVQEPATAPAVQEPARPSVQSSKAVPATTVKETPAEPAPAPVVETPETLRAAAGKGDKAAAYKLGMMYYKGEGIGKDYAAASELLLPLAEAGYPDAYFTVAEMYHFGRGVSKNKDTAVKWYQKAASAGNAKAKKILVDLL